MIHPVWPTALVAVAAILLVQPAPAAAPGFEVYHWRSEPHDDVFEETFVVHRVRIEAALEDLTVMRGDQPQAVDWGDDDGLLSVGDTMAFRLEAFDRQETLWATWQGRLVMECRFGGGAALNIHPDEWADLGQPEQVRCLDALDDS